MIASSSSGSKYQPAVAADLGQGGGVGQGDGDALGHRLDGRDAEALAERGEDQGRRLGVGGAQGLALAVAGQPDHGPAAEPPRSPRGAAGPRPRSPVPSSTRARSPEATSGSARRGADQADQVLPGLEVGHREQVGHARRAARGRRGRPPARGRSPARRTGPRRRWGRRPPGPWQSGNASSSRSVLNSGDREDQVGLAEGLRPAARGRRGAVPEVLQDVVAGHGPPGLAGRDAVLGRAVDPVDRRRPAARPAARARAATTAGASRVRTGSSRRGRSPSDSQ